MNTFAYFDFCFFEKCNIICSYCRSDNVGYRSDLSLVSCLDVVETFLQKNRAAVFKLSGYGEAALWPHLIDLLYEVSPAFPSVQVMTNGTIRSRVFDALVKIPNLSFCITLDGWEPEQNQHRCGGNGNLHRKMIDFVRKTVSAGKRLEVNCVLTQQNIDHLFDLAGSLNERFSRAVKLIPFSVRPFTGLNNEALFPTRKQIMDFGKKLENLEVIALAPALPPAGYLQRVHAFMAGQRRTTRCYMADANYGVGPALQPLYCACSINSQPSQDVGNLRSSNSPNHLEGGGCFVSTRCLACFNHYELVNMFLENELTAEALGEFPAFDFPGVSSCLQSLKSSLAGAGRTMEVGTMSQRLIA